MLELIFEMVLKRWRSREQLVVSISLKTSRCRSLILVLIDLSVCLGRNNQDSDDDDGSDTGSIEYLDENGEPFDFIEFQRTDRPVTRSITLTSSILKPNAS